jgi:hypothetical protein
MTVRNATRWYLHFVLSLFDKDKTRHQDFSNVENESTFRYACGYFVRVAFVHTEFVIMLDLLQVCVT